MKLGTGDGEVLSASSAEVVAVSLIVVDSGLREHGIILNLRLSQRRTVGSHKNQLRLSATKALQDRLVTELEFTTSDNELQFAVNAISILLLQAQIRQMPKYQLHTLIAPSTYIRSCSSRHFLQESR